MSSSNSLLRTRLVPVPCRLMVASPRQPRALSCLKIAIKRVKVPTSVSKCRAPSPSLTSSAALPHQPLLAAVMEIVLVLIDATPTRCRRSKISTDRYVYHLSCTVETFACIYDIAHCFSCPAPGQRYDSLV